MFDTMTLTKTAAALCGSLLIYMLGGWAGDALYVGGHGHGDDHHQAYVIDTGEEDAGGAAEQEQGPDFATLLAAADPAKGERVFGKCKSCHKLEDGANATGPYLHAVVGRPINGAEGFNYSGALAQAGEAWTPEVLNAFLENPKGVAKGTSMNFAGLKKPEDRADLIAFLQQQGS